MFLAIDNVLGVETAFQDRPGSLMEAQATLIAAALDDTWSVDRIVSCDDKLSLLLTPPGGADADTMFYVDASEGGLNLSVMQADDLRLHGCYGTKIEALLSAMGLVNLN